jgi:hypothetical protein
MVAFPRHSVAWELEHKTRLRRISLWLPGYGIGIGVVVRLYRWGVLSVIAPEGWGAVLGTIAIGVLLICALATGHLMNFSLPSWKWRAPALGAFLALGESAMSLVLTFLHQERLGRALATVADWPSSALNILLTRVLVVSLYALVLAAVVVALRRAEQITND